MVNKVCSQDKTPMVFAALGAGVGAVGGSKIGLLSAEKYISKNILPCDEFIKKRVAELTDVIKATCPEEKVTEKLKKLPEMIKIEYDASIYKHQRSTKNAFALIGSLLLAATGYVVSKLVIAKTQGPQLSSSLEDAKGLSGYKTTTAREKAGRYCSTTA